MREMRLFLTGGTGFFGKWLLESILWMNNEYSLNATATVLTRDPDKFVRKFPDLKRGRGKFSRRG